MEGHIYEGKNKEELLNQAYEELNLNLDNSFHYYTSEKVGLLKKEVFKLHIFSISEVVDYIKEYLKNITKDMGIEITMESSIRDKQIIIRMYSEDNNSILIGHEGKNLKALTTIVKQVVYNKIHTYPYLLLDVSNYKEKQEKRIERLAKNLAREVSKTKQPVEMENMNSYDRRLVHNILSDSKYVYTKSTGEEPNRHVVIYPKNDDIKEENEE